MPRSGPHHLDACGGSIVNKATADADGVVMTASGKTLHYDDPDYLQLVPHREDRAFSS